MVVDDEAGDLRLSVGLGVFGHGQQIVWAESDREGQLLRLSLRFAFGSYGVRTPVGDTELARERRDPALERPRLFGAEIRASAVELLVAGDKLGQSSARCSRKRGSTTC